MGVATRGWAGLLGAGLAWATIACGDDGTTGSGGPDILELTTVPLSGEQEVPRVRTEATGEATANLTGNLLRVTGTFEGLESDLHEVAGSSAHVHDGPPGESGPVVFNLQVTPGEDNRSGTFDGEMLLDMNQLQALQEGRYYVNVHTALHPSGEIRGQLTDPPFVPESLDLPRPEPEVNEDVEKARDNLPDPGGLGPLPPFPGAPEPPVEEPPAEE